MINNCINIEKSLLVINDIKEKINKLNSLNIEFKFFFGNEENVLSEKINNLGMIEYEDIKIAINIIQSQMEEYKGKTIKYKVIYDASKDGKNYDNCHSKCNNVPNTFSFIETNNCKKFGLFRSIKINGQGPWCSDDKAFFISLDKFKIYKMKHGNLISFDDTYYIQTYSFSLSGDILNDNYKSKEKKDMNKYFEGFTEDYELTGGEKEFKVKTFIVYQFEFI